MSDGGSFHIELERTGGFAGIKRQGSLDSAQLEPGDADELRALLERLDFDALTAGTSGRAGVDRYQYRLVVELQGRRTEAIFGEDELPTELRPLIERVLAAG